LHETPPFIPALKSLYLQGGLEAIGLAMDICRGVMENWSVGLLKTRVWWKEICFLYGIEQKVIDLRRTAFDPLYSMLHFPSLHSSTGSQAADANPPG